MGIVVSVRGDTKQGWSAAGKLADERPVFYDERNFNPIFYFHHAFRFLHHLNLKDWFHRSNLRPSSYLIWYGLKYSNLQNLIKMG